MLQINIPERELYDNKNQVFINLKATSLSLEHSLVSISKWESKWHKSFINSDNKTDEEIIDYIKCMTITQNVDPEIYKYIPRSEINKIVEYINDPMTATTFSKMPSKGGRKEIVTSELIYYWMIALEIPFECQKWHLNRLLTLIRVCDIKQQPTKKMTQKEIMSQNRALNNARRASAHSRG